MTKYYNPSIIQAIPLKAVEYLPPNQQIVYSWLCVGVNTNTSYSFQALRECCGIKTDKELRAVLQALKKRKLIKKILLDQLQYVLNFEVFIPDEIFYIGEK